MGKYTYFYRGQIVDKQTLVSTAVWQIESQRVELYINLRKVH